MDIKKYSGKRVIVFLVVFTILLAVDGLAINQSDCGSLSSSGVYTLYKNIISGGTCITIASNDVVLDCSGFNITYGVTGTGNGVYNGGYDNVTVKNCEIKKSGASGNINYGIYFNDANDGTVYNNTIFTNGTNDNHGIFLYTSSSINATENIVFTSGSTGNNFGIYLTGVNLTYNNVENNTVNTSGTSGNKGISLSSDDADSSYDNTISENTIHTQGTDTVLGNTGIYVANADNNVISGNTVTTNGTGSNNYGIDVTSSFSNNNTVASNTIYTIANTSLNHGINVLSADGNTITNNLITVSGTVNNYGISMVGADNHTVFNNTIITQGISSSDRGIYLGSDNNTFINNNITTKVASSSSGIYVEGNNNMLHFNIINTNSNYSYGIYITKDIQNTTISNNTIETLGRDSDGMYLFDSDGSIGSHTLDGNRIRTRGISSDGVSLTNSSSNVIKNNKINTTNSSAPGIEIREGSNNNNFINNIINASANSSPGIRIEPVNNTLDGNIIFVYGSSSDGIEIQSTANNTNITANKITVTGSWSSGVSVQGAFGSIINSNNITTLSSSAISLSSNSGFTSISSNDLKVTESGFSSVISVDSASNSSITFNIVNGSVGLSLGSSAASNNINSNDIYARGYAGISLTGTTYNTIGSNNISMTSDGWNSGLSLDANTASNYIGYNFINASGEMGTGIRLGNGSASNTLEANDIHVGSVGIHIENISGENNIFINNKFSSATNGIIYDETPSNITYSFVYNNSFGSISWTNSNFLGNLTFNVSGSQGFGLGKNLYIGNNTVALNTSAITLGNLNSSADITLYNLSFGGVASIIKLGTFSNDSSEILNDGANCVDTSCEILNYNSSSGTLLFNTTSFSSFSAKKIQIVYVTNLSLLYSNSSAYAVLHFDITNLDNANHTFNWSLDTGEEIINSDFETNLSASETIFVFIENNYSSTGSYIIEANGTTGLDLDTETVNITIS